MLHFSWIQSPRHFLRLCTLIILPLSSIAQAESRVRICNQTTRDVTYADAMEDPQNGVTSMGWYRLSAGNCGSWITTGSPNLYVTGHTNALDWSGPNQLCVDRENPSGFKFAHADSIACDGSGQTRYGFEKIALTAGDNTFTFRETSARRIGYTLNVCNRSSETVTLALGVEAADGTYSDGWYSIESDKCRIFEETGKFDFAYLNANSPGNLLEWSGPTPLCVSWNKAFYFANTATSSCDDGDSKLRGFVKIPLTGGSGNYNIVGTEAVKNNIGINLCNSTNTDIYAALVTQDSLAANGMTANGWKHIRPSECILAGAVSVGPVYLYAEDDDGFDVWNGSDLQACMHDYNAFTIPNADTVDCNNPGQSRHGFMRWEVSAGANVYTFK